MNILLLGSAVLAVAYFVKLGKVAATAKDLIATFKKAQIYHFASGGSMTVRAFVDITNLHETEILIQAADLKAQLDGITIGTCYVENIKIAKGKHEMYFDLVMPWANLGVAAAVKVRQWFGSGTVTPPDKCIVSGKLKAENFIMDINYTIPFSRS